MQSLLAAGIVTTSALPARRYRSSLYRAVLPLRLSRGVPPYLPPRIAGSRGQLPRSCPRECWPHGVRGVRSAGSVRPWGRSAGNEHLRGCYVGHVCRWGHLPRMCVPAGTSSPDVCAGGDVLRDICTCGGISREIRPTHWDFDASGARRHTQSSKPTNSIELEHAPNHRSQPAPWNSNTRLTIEANRLHVILPCGTLDQDGRRETEDIAVHVLPPVWTSAGLQDSRGRGSGSILRELPAAILWVLLPLRDCGSPQRAA